MSAVDLAAANPTLPNIIAALKYLAQQLGVLQGTTTMAALKTFPFGAIVSGATPQTGTIRNAPSRLVRLIGRNGSASGVVIAIADTSGDPSKTLFFHVAATSDFDIPVMSANIEDPPTFVTGMAWSWIADGGGTVEGIMSVIYADP